MQWRDCYIMHDITLLAVLQIFLQVCKSLQHFILQNADCFIVINFIAACSYADIVCVIVDFEWYISSLCCLSYCEWICLSVSTLYFSLSLSVGVVGVVILCSVTKHWSALIRRTTNVNLNAIIMRLKINCHRSFHRQCIQTQYAANTNGMQQ